MTTGFFRELKTPREGRFSFESTLCLVGALLIALSWLTTEHFLPWVSWHSEVIAFFAVFSLALALVLTGLRSANGFRIQVPLLALPFALLAAIAVLQLLTGTLTFGGDALVVGFYMALCGTCVVLGFNAGPQWSPTGDLSGAGRWNPPSWVALAFVAGSGASAVVAFAQVFDVWGHSGWIVRMPELRRPGGNVAQPNQLATLLVMGVASVAFLHASGKLGRMASAVLVLLLCAGLAMSESRSGALGLVALLTWWQARRKSVAGNVSGWAAPVVAAGFAVLFVAWPHLLNALELTGSQAVNRLTHGDLRLAVWSQLLEAVLQRPWWGWGVLEVAEAHNTVAHAHGINNPFSYSHNLVLDLAVWMGIPIAAGLTVAAAGWAVTRTRAAKRLLPWYCIAITVPLAVHSMLELPFAYAYFLAPALFLLGVLERTVGARALFGIESRTGTAVLALVAGLMVWSVVEYLSIEEDFRIVRFEQLRIGSTPQSHHRPQVVLLTQLGALLDGSRIDLAPGMSADKLAQLRRLAMRYPWVATQYRYATALALNGQPEEAARQIQVIRWQRDEKTYAAIKMELGRLAETSYPQLRSLNLP